MGQRVKLCSSLAAAANSAGTLFRTAKRPFRVVGTGGYTGSVNLQHSVDPIATADSAATWYTIGTIASGDDIELDTPVHRLRVNGGHSAGTATVYLIESCH